jgi:Neutral/alkaline non-lysosomal ceramidase.
MYFGVAKETITPYFKVKLAGFSRYSGNHFDSIHDDLYAHALILEDEEHNKALIVALDVLFHNFTLTEEIMAFAQEKCDISRDNILLNYSHTHNGPALRDYDAWEYSGEYERYLVEGIKRCILRAEANKTMGVASYAAVAGDWNISRRLIVDGNCECRPNLMGSRDGTLHILKFADMYNSARCMLFSFPCHPSSTGGRIPEVSAEYPGRLCQLVDAMLYGNTSIFLQGFGGDVKSRHAVSDNGQGFKAAGFHDINRMASGMFDAVEHAFLTDTFKPVDFKLAGKHFNIPLKIDLYPKEFFLDQYGKLKQETEFLGNCARYVVENYDNLKDILELHGSIMKLSDDLYIFALGGEPSHDVSVILKKAFPGKKIIFIGYCDDSAYIPSNKLIEEGGYEADGSVVEYRLKGKIAIGADEALIQGFKEGIAFVDGMQRT